MKYVDINWLEPTKFYFIRSGPKKKFGITKDWDRRNREYVRMFDGINPEILFTKDFANRWQAELIEQVVKWRLWDFIYDGNHEWVREEFPYQNVIACINLTINELEPEFYKYSNIHTYGSDRGHYYRQIASSFKESYC